MYVGHHAAISSRREMSFGRLPFAGAILEGAEFLVITVVQSKYRVKFILEHEVRVSLSVLCLRSD